MSETLTVIFDGEVFRPEKPVKLPPNTRYEINLSQKSASNISVEEEDISPGLTQEMEELKLLGDKALWKVASQSHLTAKERQKLAQLNSKQQREGPESLAEEEVKLKDELLYEYERRMLIRAQALVLLKQRGLDISKLLKAS